MVDEVREVPHPHLIVPGQPEGEAFTSRGRGGPTRIFGIPNRRRHAETLRRSLEEIAASATVDQTAWPEDLSASGFVFAAEAWPGFELAVESLERKRSGIELVKVRPGSTERGEPELALVYVPNNKTQLFFSRLDRYAEEQTRAGRPKEERLVANLAAFRMATLEQLWADDSPFPGTEEAIWWEVWLRRTGDELFTLAELADRLGWDRATTAIEFPDRTITAIRATRESLGATLGTRLPIAELRAPRLVESPSELPPEEQARLARDLVARVQPADDNAPAVCLLDTGIHRHTVFGGSLSADDIHHVVGVDGLDRHGHGTEQAGIALFGDVLDALTSGQLLPLRHRLESVKFLPDPEGPPNAEEIYGAVTASGVATPEAAAPDRRRVFCVATTDASVNADGRPSSWSATVDALSFGTDVVRVTGGVELLSEPNPEAARLLVVAAGNIRDGYRRDHLDVSSLMPIQDPGQSWNALTVGAFTQLVDAPTTGPLAGWSAIAPAGELSPFSTTSVTFARRWPVKPDIVLEGGNVLISPGSDTDFSESVSLTTTSRQEPIGRAFTTTGGTSPAAAQAARLAALVAADYPDLWPETIRGLLVHAAEWTEPMQAHFGTSRGSTALRLVRRYGFGVPTEDRVLQSAASDVTLISQASIQPIEMSPAGAARLREMHVHELPWPMNELLALGETEVRLRVTLSYFVEPNPSSRGWRGKYAYASHGLRFDIRRPGERIPDFRARLNEAAQTEEAGGPPVATGQDPAWLLGPQVRSVGSLHADFWTGTAADLADAGIVGVYPVGGWWKNNNRGDRAALPVRYSLIVSISTPELGIDLYTPTAVQIVTPITIQT